MTLQRSANVALVEDPAYVATQAGTFWMAAAAKQVAGRNCQMPDAFRSMSTRLPRASSSQRMSILRCAAHKMCKASTAGLNPSTYVENMLGWACA